MPLHITKNYNGQYSGQSGVHSRYESSLIEKFQSEIIYNGDSLQYIDNMPAYVFNMIYDNYSYVDSVLYADSLAHAFAGNTSDTIYYNKFWQIAKKFTIGLFKKASYRLTCVIYTAWINAENNVSDVAKNNNSIPLDFNLSQNYPNPFNPVTIISYQLPETEFVTLKIYDILGNEVVTLVNEEKPAGSYNVSFDASKLPSGVYFYTLITDNFKQSKKMILMK
ncbi:MAG: T9SS type A sorting domain-containing protein [Ignavibacteriaceae bacterium]